MKGLKKIFFLFLLPLLPYKAAAQVQMPDGRYRLLTTIVNGDTIPLVNMSGVEIVAPLSPEAAAKMQAYLKLRRDVLRAYPYAKLAAVQLRFINDSIAKIPNEKERKKFVKATEKDLKEQFEKDLKKLTVTQGRILIKLVDRETGSTSYALVKELRGSLQAFFWQGLARLFGSNLKSEYDGEGNDAQIEQIVQQIERGELKVQKIK
ncbi:MAG TPA: DUF4294 domain-containing protein [Bacteroidia bacterium]|jgi:hypothetical protein|nr:DUF4294 domain-containing protein [Bacteroidia bacterium]HQF29268.1 DUF4294 domain-containing protein [Bacteroidia bacterium]